MAAGKIANEYGISRRARVAFGWQRSSGAREESLARSAKHVFLMLAVLAFAAICLRTAVLTLASREKDALRFEEEPPSVVICLQLDRD